MKRPITFKKILSHSMREEKGSGGEVNISQGSAFLKHSLTFLGTYLRHSPNHTADVISFLDKYVGREL